jgi:large subunit ribosomal protein L28
LQSKKVIENTSIFKVKTLSKVCELTGTTVRYGNNVSHANNRTRRRFLPNLQKKRIWIPEEGRFITVKATARALRTLDKKGYAAMMKDLASK